MPWTGAEFKSRHNHSLKSGAQANKAASIANAILKKSGDEAKAIRIANATIRRMGRG
jgi:uncharacterized protein YdaT